MKLFNYLLTYSCEIIKLLNYTHTQVVILYVKYYGDCFQYFKLNYFKLKDSPMDKIVTFHRS